MDPIHRHHSIGQDLGLHLEGAISTVKASACINTVIAVASIAFGALAAVYGAPAYLFIAVPICIMSAWLAGEKFKLVSNLSKVANNILNYITDAGQINKDVLKTDLTKGTCLVKNNALEKAKALSDKLVALKREAVVDQIYTLLASDGVGEFLRELPLVAGHAVTEMREDRQRREAYLAEERQRREAYISAQAQARPEPQARSTTDSESELGTDAWISETSLRLEAEWNRRSELGSETRLEPEVLFERVSSQADSDSRSESE